MDRWNGVTFEVLNPPVMKHAVGSDEEWLLWQRCFRECIGDIGAKHEEVLCDGNCIKETSTCLLHTIHEGFGKHDYFAGTGRSVADPAGLFMAINGFYAVCPHKVENCVAIGCHDRGSKHALRVVLI